MAIWCCSAAVAVAAVITYFADPPWWQILLIWGICLLPALAVSRMGWLKVFGPVLYYDMIRQARRSRFAFLRFFYVLVLVVLFFFVLVNVTDFRLGGADTNQAPVIAENYFNTFMIAQFVTVVLLTPAYVAGAIAEEKDRKTLEFMLATDLLNREIVLSKLGSRLGNLALVVLTGLPILSLIQFLGGVDPNLVLATFAVTAMTIVGQAGFSIYCSATCRKPREAIMLSYLAVVLYFGVWGLQELVLLYLTPIGGTFFNILSEWNDFYNKGNFIKFFVEVAKAGRAGTLSTALPVLVGGYAAFHGTVAVLTVALAVARLRRVALAQSYDKPVKGSDRWRLWPRPAVGSFPMVWKEMNCEGAGRASWLSRIVFTLIVAVIFAPAGVIVYVQWDRAFQSPITPQDDLSWYMNLWGRFAFAGWGWLACMAVAVRASSSISNERDKQTFDTLLTTPLDSSSILFGKWLGSLLSLRYGIFLLLLIGCVGIVTGGLSLAAVPLMIAAWFIYAGFAAALGLWFSVVSRSSLKATVFTIMTLIGLHVGHWLPWMCCGFMMRGGPDSEHLLKLQACVLTPPFVLGWLPFCTENLTQRYGDRFVREWLEPTAYCVMGLLAWTLATVLLYSMTSMRFRWLTNRTTFLPESDIDWRSLRAGPDTQAVPSTAYPWALPVGPVMDAIELPDQGKATGGG